MGFTEILTIVFIVLKLIGIISWSWWLVLLPEIIALVIYIVLVIGTMAGVHKTNKYMRKRFDDDFWN